MLAININQNTNFFEFPSILSSAVKFFNKTLDGAIATFYLSLTRFYLVILNVFLDKDFKRIESMLDRNDIESMKNLDLDKMYSALYKLHDLYELYEILEPHKNDARFKGLATVCDISLDKLARTENYYGYVESALNKVS